jgi:hypothetical protein
MKWIVGTFILYTLAKGNFSDYSKLATEYNQTSENSVPFKQDALDKFFGIPEFLSKPILPSIDWGFNGGLLNGFGLFD